MKHLPLKLGIGVVLLFAAVITTCLLWTPVRIRYYVGKLHSDKPKERVTGVDGLIGIGEKGISALADDLNCSIKESQFIAKFWNSVTTPITESYGGGYFCYPLHLAVEKGYKDTVKLLLLNSADPSIRDKQGETPLHTATFHGEKQIILILLNAGVDVNVRDNDGWTPLCKTMAFCVYKEKIAPLLIEKGADVNAHPGDGRMPIHWAAQKGLIDLVRLFIEKGADVNARDDQGIAPIHLAAWEGHKEIILFLVSKGADINVMSKDGETPADFAKEYGSEETVAFLRSHAGKTGEEIREKENKETRK